MEQHSWCRGRGPAQARAREKRLQGDVIPPPIHGSDALKKAVLRAIEFSPEKRYCSAADFRKALESALSKKTTVNTDPEPVGKSFAKDDKKAFIFGNAGSTTAKKKISIRKLVPILGVACLLGISLFIVRKTLLHSNNSGSSGNSVSDISKIESTVHREDSSAGSYGTDSMGTESKEPGEGGRIVQQPPGGTASVTAAPDSNGSGTSGKDGNPSEKGGSGWSTSSVAGSSRTNKEPSARIYTLTLPDSFSVDIKIDGKSKIIESSDSSFLITRFSLKAILTSRCSLIF